MELITRYWSSWAIEVFEGPNGQDIYELEVWSQTMFSGISRKLLGYSLAQCAIQALDCGEIIENLSVTLAQSANYRG